MKIRYDFKTGKVKLYAAKEWEPDFDFSKYKISPPTINNRSCYRAFECYQSQSFSNSQIFD